MEIRYFAYGSNLCLRRLRDRAPSARPEGRATLPGYRLCWHKRSADGSGKCSVSASENAIVHGVLFSMPAEEKVRLDAVEGLGNGYADVEVAVESKEGRVLASTYVATEEHVDESLKPYSWYRDLVIAGARTFGLPGDYIESLRQVSAIEDPRTERDGKNRRSVPCAGPVAPG